MYGNNHSIKTLGYLQLFFGCPIFNFFFFFFFGGGGRGGDFTTQERISDKGCFMYMYNCNRENRSYLFQHAG